MQHEGAAVTDRVFNVVFLCTHNSCRSVIAESILNKLGSGHVKACSAGSHPSGRINPGALDLLQRMNDPTDSLSSTSWDGFAADGGPALDFIFTVCDDAAGETCPFWPGYPATAHGGVADPSRVEGSEPERRRAFDETHRPLHQRIAAFAALPILSVSCENVVQQNASIGQLR